MLWLSGHFLFPVHPHPQHPAHVTFISVILSNVWFAKPPALPGLLVIIHAIPTARNALLSSLPPPCPTSPSKFQFQGPSSQGRLTCLPGKSGASPAAPLDLPRPHQCLLMANQNHWVSCWFPQLSVKSFGVRPCLVAMCTHIPNTVDTQTGGWNIPGQAAG